MPAIRYGLSAVCAAFARRCARRGWTPGRCSSMLGATGSAGMVCNAGKYLRPLVYEKLGGTRLFACYAIPDDCDTVFFPGCDLPGARPGRVIRLFEVLRRKIPALGMVLDCCGRISHDLGRSDHFKNALDHVIRSLKSRGVKHILAGCPSCFRVFRDYAGGISTRMVYDLLAEDAPRGPGLISSSVTVHDPCSVRFDAEVQKAVRALVSAKGCSIEEMEHSGLFTYCCGQGGAVQAAAPGLAGRWGEKRRGEAGRRLVVTYCSGCATALVGSMPVAHILDLWFDPEAVSAGKASGHRSPMTYINRLKLKAYLRRTFKCRKP